MVLNLSSEPPTSLRSIGKPHADSSPALPLSTDPATARSTITKTKPSPNPRGRPKKSINASTSDCDPNHSLIHTDPALTQLRPFPPISPVSRDPHDQLEALYSSDDMFDQEETESGGETKKRNGKASPGKGTAKTKTKTTRAGIQKTTSQKITGKATKKMATATKGTAGKATPKKAVAGKKWDGLV